MKRAVLAALIAATLVGCSHESPTDTRQTSSVAPAPVTSAAAKVTPTTHLPVPTTEAQLSEEPQLPAESQSSAVPPQDSGCFTDKGFPIQLTGPITCSAAKERLAWHLRLGATGQYGSAKIVHQDGWSCAAPKRGTAKEKGYGQVCINDAQGIKIVVLE